MKFLTPWRESTDEALLTELQRKVPRGHFLYEIPVKVLGRRDDKDEVLFELQDDTGRLVAVHLTFQVETDIHWPHFSVFASEAEWIQRMQADHVDFEV